MGHQCIGQVFGGSIVRAPCGVMHGKTSLVYHTGVGLLEVPPTAPFPSDISTVEFAIITCRGGGTWNTLYPLIICTGLILHMILQSNTALNFVQVVRFL